ncbi:Mak10 subunit, NatC N-terminal acetyltransferase-domain-containing protein [Chytridium lagenaria]|nr:Mak10 subunit, NatC N-terminal acetyltransferase-domain-containing protein [Chytridium lagenaria]
MKSIAEEVSELALGSPSKSFGGQNAPSANVYEDFKRGLHDHTSYRDITTLLIEASQHLEVGEMIKCTHFTLWDSMSATEIMDQKMDSGYDYPGRVVKAMPAKTDLITMRLPGEKLNGWMDKLMEMEMTCMRGNPLTQTLFTCPLLHYPHELQSKILREVATSFLKGVDLWRQIVIQARVFEDEEFTFDPVTFSLCTEVDVSECITGLLDVEEDLLIIWRNLKGKNAQDPLESIELIDGKETMILEALLARIRFRKAFIQTLNFILKRNLSSAKKSVSQAIIQLKACSHTLDSSKDVTDLFDSDLNRRIFADGPPRNVLAISLNDAFDDLHHLLSEISEVINLNSLTPLRPLLLFMSRFSSRNPNPNILSRSILSHVILQHGRIYGKTSISDALRDSVSNIFTVSLFAKQIPIVEGKVHEFIELTIKKIESLLRLYGFNRSRQRRMMLKLIQEFDIVQAKVEEIDLSLHKLVGFTGKAESFLAEPFYLSSWIYQLKIDLLIETQFMGFELDIFSTYEYPVIFNYLDNLFGNAVAEIDRVKASTRIPEESEVNDVSAKKVKGQKDRSKSEETISPLDALTDEMRLFILAKQALSRVSSNLAYVFIREGLVTNPDPDLFNPEIQFNNRFKVFSCLGSPPPLTFAQMSAIIDSVGKSSTLDLLSLVKIQLEYCDKLLKAVRHSLANVQPDALRTHVTAPDLDRLSKCVEVNLNTASGEVDVKEAKSEKLGTLNVKARVLSGGFFPTPDFRFLGFPNLVRYIGVFFLKCISALFQKKRASALFNQFNTCSPSAVCRSRVT